MDLSTLNVKQIVRWAKAHRRRTGAWPHRRQKIVIAEAAPLTWATIDGVLRCGSRGLAPTSLARLLDKFAGARLCRSRIALTEAQILRWADAHKKRTGDWPHVASGPVREATDETWVAIDAALRHARRGLPSKSSLSRLLVQHRAPSEVQQRVGARQVKPGGRNTAYMPRPLPRCPTINEIVKWMDAHHQRTGSWPTYESGPIAEAPPLTWRMLNGWLRKKWIPRLTDVNSIADILRRKRGIWHADGSLRLRKAQIVVWAKAHYQRTGRWPEEASGRIHGTPQETWARVSSALRYGLRGLPGGSSLYQLLLPLRLKYKDPRVRPLHVKDVLTWADQHHRRTGQWPVATLGRVHDEPALTWCGIQGLLVRGARGLPRTTLARLLAKHRGVWNRRNSPPIKIAQILAWADEHYKATGDWPSQKLGRVLGTDHERWSAINSSLVSGARGLPGGSSIVRLLLKHRSAQYRGYGSLLTIDQILEWADEHRERTGSWPHAGCGRIVAAPSRMWSSIDGALIKGACGLPGGTSINRLLTKYRGKRDRLNPPPLQIKQILAWADMHYETTGEWPSSESGRVIGAEPEHWRTINLALMNGRRGLSGGSSIVKLLSKYRSAQYYRRGTPLSLAQIIEWAIEHHELHGDLPTAKSGPLRDHEGEDWKAIDAALRYGSRKLRGGSSLAELLEERYRLPYKGIGQRLTVRTIEQWARDFYKRADFWPTRDSAYVFPPKRGEKNYRGERWQTIDTALREGLRGLRGGSSLRQLVARLK